MRTAGGDLLQRALEPGIGLHAIEHASSDQRSDPRLRPSDPEASFLPVEVMSGPVSEPGAGASDHRNRAMQWSSGECHGFVRCRDAMPCVGRSGSMIPVPASTRVWLCAGVTDMAPWVQPAFRRRCTRFSRPTRTRAIFFVCRGRRGDLLKVIWWDGQRQPLRRASGATGASTRMADEHGHSRPQPLAASSSPSEAPPCQRAMVLLRGCEPRCSRIHIREHFETRRGQGLAGIGR